MRSTSSTRSARWPWVQSAGIVALAGLFALLLLQFGVFSWKRAFRVDEFQYAHASWLVSHGQVPYRDFFDHHYSLPYQVLAPLWWWIGDRIDGMQQLRLAALSWNLIATAAVMFLARRGGLTAITVAGLGALTFPPLIDRSIEIRPDLLAVTFYLGALAILDCPRLTHQSAKTTAGLLTGLALTSSVKVWVYGLPLGLCFAVAVWKRCDQGDSIFGRPWIFPLAVFAPILSYLLWLAWVGALPDFIRWCFYWVAEHERQATLFSPWPPVFLIIKRFPLLLVGVAVGAFIAATSAKESIDRKQVTPIVLGSAVFAFISYAIQKAPFAYSLVPFFYFSLILLGLGVARLVDALTPSHALEPSLRQIIHLTASLVFATLAVFCSSTDRAVMFDSNHLQVAQQQRYDELLQKDAVVYDNTGAMVARPHAYYTYFTSVFIRRQQAAQLEEEIPPAIRSNRTVAWLNDARATDLPSATQDFLHRHFIRVQDDLHLWGAKLQPGRTVHAFEANRSGVYFVWPNGDGVTIDGQEISETNEITLQRGEHSVERSKGSDALWIIWRPASKEHLAPLQATEARKVYL